MWSKNIISLLAIAGLAVEVFSAPVKEVLNAGAPGTIPNAYIVVFKKDVSQADIDAHTNVVSQSVAKSDLVDTMGKGKIGKGLKKIFKIAGGLKGYSGGFDKLTLQTILNSPLVDYVEQDAVVKINARQNGAGWGLARVSHSNFVSPYSYDYNIVVNSLNVTVFVIDTGIRITHSEFQNADGTRRATWGTNTIDSDNTDGNGHGTHCAGTAVGKTYGVARKANVVAVKVLDANGDGTWSSVLAGMNWVAANAKPNYSVVSLSLGGGKSTSINNAIDTLWNAGIISAVAAGNEGEDASNSSPASAPKALTVGAIDQNGFITSWSDYGTVLDLFAPGDGIVSAWKDSDTSTATLSGTSMSTPHVAGLAAYFICRSTGGSTPDQTTTTILNTGVKNQVKGDLKGSPNVIAYNGFA
ncbi:hypothetical protein H072_6469 [Dactylellina haptotyla CBS 200.50]|uniref:Cuticle-degrading serine protease n=1 Tax=Dactylellina haptotyla (strain CBS 200.50) TaxID=1284197 RepID=S8A9P9_DACHA|nr:hypothetical protein H072_6469 [Dactylellina haptotyla CBS 200.50]